jgi:hypothetical protein
VLHDHGRWISGPSLSTEPVAAEEVEPGDILLLDDGTRAEVSDTAYGFYWLPGGHQQGVALGWRSGSASGLLFRRADDILRRIAGEA